jgi:hypothetical protein
VVGIVKQNSKRKKLIPFRCRQAALAVALLCLCSFNAETVLAQTAPPTISVGTGFYNNDFYGNVYITAAPGSTIYYNVGSPQPPTTSSTQYTHGFYAASQVNAIAVSAGVASTVTTSVIAIDPDAGSTYGPFAFVNGNTQFWYRGDGGFLTTGGTNNLNWWADLSGQSNNATAVSPSYPILEAAANNGKYAVSFSGTNFLSLPSGFSSLSSGLSLFAVIKPNALTSGAQIISFGDGSDQNNAITLSENSSYQPTFSVYSSAGASTSVSATAPLSTSNYQLVEIVQSGTTATLFVNGTQMGQNSSMNAIPSVAHTANYIGQATTGGSNYTGNISELLCYNTALSASQRVQVEAYYLAKYQLPMQTVATTFVPPPIFSLVGGSLSKPSQLAIQGRDNQTIYVTTDGSTPSPSTSPEYTGPFNVHYSQTVKAIAVTTEGQSSVTSATFTLDGTKWPAPSSGGPTLQINVSSPNVAN